MINTNYLLLDIYRAIKDGYTTTDSLLTRFKLSRSSLCKKLKILKDHNIIEKRYAPASPQGKPSYVYNVSDMHHCLFIEKRSNMFALISISANGKPYAHTKIPSTFALLSPSNTLKFLLKAVRKNKYHKNCRAIYLTGDELDNFIVDDDIEIISIEKLIFIAYRDQKKIYYLDINNKSYLSIYSNLQEAHESYELSSRVLKIDKYVKFTDESKYEVLFEALKLRTNNLIEEYILNIT